MTIRDTAIQQARDAARYNDTLIMQKVNASHRIAFAEKYPNQVEHILRLITERLQNGLAWNKKEDSDDLHLTVDEINNLAQAMLSVHTIRQSIKVE